MALDQAESAGVEGESGVEVGDGDADVVDAQDEVGEGLRPVDRSGR